MPSHIHIILTKSIQAATALSLAAMSEAHDEVTENIRLHADLINMPRFGSPDNYAYGAAQLNIAPAQAANSGMEFPLNTEAA